jgi:hypothetical protein
MGDKAPKNVKKASQQKAQAQAKAAAAKGAPKK